MSRKIVRNSLIYLLLMSILFIALTPLFFTWFTAFKSKTELISNVFGLPRDWQWNNISRAWIQGHFGTYYQNSVLVVIPVLFLSLILSIMNSYAFVYFRIPGKKQIFQLFILGLAVPMEVVMIQQYFHMQNLGLLNTRAGLIMAQVAMSIPFGTFFITSSLRGLPSAVVESAEVDGADTWKILWLIISPLLTPALVAASIFFFIWTWNEFLLALVLISKEELRTLPLGMAYFQGKYVGDSPLMAMGATLMTLPIILFYIGLQKYFISGIVSGSVKE